MMGSKKAVHQFRYYSDGNPLNTLLNNGPLTKADMISGNFFSGYANTIQLGIQTVPGVKFWIGNTNSNEKDIYSPIIIGPSGTYEVELDEATCIDNIQFSAESMNLIETPTGYLIIDIVYLKNDNNLLSKMVAGPTNQVEPDSDIAFSVYNHNDGTNIAFWAGRSEDLPAAADRSDNVVYFTTDDNSSGGGV